MLHDSLVFASLLLFFTTGLASEAATRGKSKVISQNDLVAAWLFDEGSGTELADASPHAFEGAFKSGSPQWVEGKFGKALSFNGVNDFAETSRPVTVSSVDITMGVWVKPNAKQKTYANILSSHEEPPKHGISIEMIRSEANHFHFAIGDGRTFNANNEKGVNVVPEVWQHLVVRRAGKVVQYILDGKIMALVKGSGLPALPATSNFRFGNWVRGDREFHGAIDEAFLVKRALTNNELRLIRTKGLAKAFGLKAPPAGAMKEIQKP